MGIGSVFNYFNVKNLFVQTNFAVKNRTGRTEAKGLKINKIKELNRILTCESTQTCGLQVIPDRVLGIMPTTNSGSLYPWVKTSWPGDTGGVTLNQ